jgi:hypothetical protein
MTAAIASNSASPVSPPKPPTPLFAPPPAVPKATPPNLKSDSVVSNAARLVKQNATNIVDSATGVASAPHAVVQAYADAAKASGALADKVEATLANWSTQTASQR